ncbi:exopolysaccharide Pel transporter PelG [Gracilinema caldarium]|uniref:exopolysaccharide Pel transporter PelG n=1 Tax=Gracilinema caldarium TaxID=215591 RepID=UPI0026EC6645|nr:exopolysaccharide Pel transporter PelG [Gracilinema caldarium]
MAGIGFQLRKIISRGNLYETIGALVSGVFIVAGPWLISVVAMALLQGFLATLKVEHLIVFQVVVVYSYAFSLSLFSALHHHFTRIIADLVWESRHGEAASWMLRFLLLAVVLSLAIAIPVSFIIPLQIGNDEHLFRMGITALFTVINILWIIMLFISLLKQYLIILLVFLGGMGISVFTAPILAQQYGVAGALLGYTGGLAVIDVFFLTIALVKYPPKKPEQGWKTFWQYLGTYGGLIASGFFFYAGQWLDKLFFWFFKGETIQGIGLKVFPAYDYTVYIAGLSIIPGLVYFVIIAETQIYIDTRHFLFTLTHTPWTKIQIAKQKLLSSLKNELKDQSLLQGFCTLGFGFLLYLYGPESLKNPIMALSLAAAFFQFTLMTVLVYLYYFELYQQAMVTALLYFILNGPIAGLIYWLIPLLLPGAGHLASGAIATYFGYHLLKTNTRKIEKILFLRALGMKKSS